MKFRTVRAFDLITSRQSDWALQRGLSVDEKNYLPSMEQNLFAPLSKATRDAFLSGAGNELEDRPGKPAKMRALHSSSALVCNLFDYWTSRDATAIGRAFGLEVEEIKFESRLLTGLRGTLPTPDLFMLDRYGKAYAVESKFAEPFRSRKSSVPFAASYFKDLVGIWARHSLPKCQRLAERLRCGEMLFRYLDAPQLLKHALGLKRTYATGVLTLL